MSIPNAEDVKAVRMLVRLREDFQAMRKRVDNRIGRKADGTKQNIDERPFRPEDIELFGSISEEARRQENEIQKSLKKVLKRFPVYTEFLQHVKGVGEIAAGWIVGEYDIHIASTVSKLWQFTGLNPGMVRGRKKDGDKIIFTDIMIRGDRLTPGFLAPFNKRLRTAMVGVLADGFIKQQNEYAMNYYYPYKERLTHEEKWEDEKPGHRDRAAKRYMIKMFLKDLYAAWREIEGLEVRPPYQDEYLGHKHSA